MSDLSLGQKQRLFTRLIGLLIAKAYAEGYELTFGDAYRSLEESMRLNKLNKGISNSLHSQRLAVDFNLFKDGQFLTSTKDHEPLGLYWESLHPLCRWGGRFNDGNHYSITHGGLK